MYDLCWGDLDATLLDFVFMACQHRTLGFFLETEGINEARSIVFSISIETWSYGNLPGRTRIAWKILSLHQGRLEVDHDSRWQIKGWDGLYWKEVRVSNLGFGGTFAATHRYMSVLEKRTLELILTDHLYPPKKWIAISLLVFIEPPDQFWNCILRGSFLSMMLSRLVVLFKIKVEYK